MILSALVIDAYRTYRGKTSNVPQPGSVKYADIVGIANRKQREWASDPNVDWPSRFEIRTYGTVTTGTQEYDLDSDVNALSDFVTLIDSSNNKTRVNVLKAWTLSEYTTGCYLSGSNPLQLTFLTIIDASLTGRTLSIPLFSMPGDMVNPTDTVVIDDPNWLIYAVAAELARNDYAKEEQYGNIKAQADLLYTNMVSSAESNSFLQPNGVPNNWPQPAPISNLGYNPWGNK